MSQALNSAAILRVVELINDDGALALAPRALIEAGLPSTFVQAHVVTTGDASVGSLDTAVPDGDVERVWSLEILGAIADCLRVPAGDAPETSDPSLQARTLSAVIRHHLQHRDLDQSARETSDPRRELRLTRDELTRLDEAFAAYPRRASAVAAAG